MGINKACKACILMKLGEIVVYPGLLQLPKVSSKSDEKKNINTARLMDESSVKLLLCGR